MRSRMLSFGAVHEDVARGRLIRSPDGDCTFLVPE